MIDGKRGHHRVWLHNCAPTDYLTSSIPLDTTAPQRSAASERFCRFLMHQHRRKLASGIVPTTYQRSRLILLLRLLDAEQEGLSRRKMAFTILYPHHIAMRSAEWKASNERRRFYRMLEEAYMICRNGYRRMLKGPMNEIHIPL
ncbi:MAG: DNA -binding domain-containing protein [Parasphingorhabdus sp.]